jgi:hypothetical protein
VTCPECGASHREDVHDGWEHAAEEAMRQLWRDAIGVERGRFDGDPNAWLAHAARLWRIDGKPEATCHACVVTGGVNERYLLGQTGGSQ